MERLVCIHGHFYQPPRENPWIEEIEGQESAYPYHDWNERVTQECYSPNAWARILDGQGRIAKIANNYERISFNFGPTLLSWMERHASETYRRIVEADARSRERFSGHGNAIAQAYNHSILPLSSARDVRTQVLWGLEDFRRRFGRETEGMWLPETAVDVDALEVLAELGVRFTVLAPHQARRVRPLDGSSEWEDVTGARIDPTRAYVQNLPSGRSIALFFYDGPASRGIAFEGLLRSGEDLARRLVGLFSTERGWDQIAHVATDGETYGHHHHHGDMALAYALETIERRPGVRLTNYGEFLERHPPEWEVEILPRTSWSCAHGVDRWRSDCGCAVGEHAGASQAWRRPLRAALDWLRNEIAPLYRQRARELLRDPWRARDEYVAVVLDRSPESVGAFLREHAVRELSSPERTRVLELMELQRHAMLMYTSCGWFFDELSRIETVQVLLYAGRAIQLARRVLSKDLEPGFLQRLEQARSNLPEMGDCRSIYLRFVRPAVVDLPKVAAHYALSILFEDGGRPDSVFCYDTEQEAHHLLEAGRARLAAGRVRVESRITGEEETFAYGTLHFGDHNLTGAVRPFRGDAPFARMREDVSDPFLRGDLTETLRRLDRHFGERLYSVNSLFRDQQRRVMELVLDSTLAEVEEAYRRIFDAHFPLMRFISDMDATPPRALRTAAELVLNTDLRRMIESGDVERDEVDWRLDAARDMRIELDHAGLALALGRTVERLAARLRAAPDDLDNLRRLENAVELAIRLPTDVALWAAQNVLYDMVHAERLRAAPGSAPLASAWPDRVRALAVALSIRVETP